MHLKLLYIVLHVSIQILPVNISIHIFNCRLILSIAFGNGTQASGNQQVWIMCAWGVQKSRWRTHQACKSSSGIPRLSKTSEKKKPNPTEKKKPFLICANIKKEKWDY